MDDLISRQEAIKTIEEYADRLQMVNWKDNPNVPYKVYSLNWCINTIRDLPSAQSEISRIEQELHGKTPEEQYEFLYWLLLKFALTYTDSRLAVVEWLRG